MLKLLIVIYWEIILKGFFSNCQHLSRYISFNEFLATEIVIMMVDHEDFPISITVAGPCFTSKIMEIIGNEFFIFI